MPSVPPQTEGRECRLKKQTMANIGSSEQGDNGNYPLLELAHTDWDNWGWHWWSLSLSDCVRKRPHGWLVMVMMLTMMAVMAVMVKMLTMMVMANLMMAQWHIGTFAQWVMPTVLRGQLYYQLRFVKLTTSTCTAGASFLGWTFDLEKVLDLLKTLQCSVCVRLLSREKNAVA